MTLRGSGQLDLDLVEEVAWKRHGATRGTPLSEPPKARAVRIQWFREWSGVRVDDLIRFEVEEEPPRLQPKRSALQLGLLEDTRDHPYGRRLGVDEHVERVRPTTVLPFAEDVTIRSVCRLMSPLA